MTMVRKRAVLVFSIALVKMGSLMQSDL